MDTMKDWCKENGVKLASGEKRAGELLERRGWKFLVDFGYGNAVEVAKNRLNFNLAPTKDTVNAEVLNILRKGYQWWSPWALQTRLQGPAKGTFISEAAVTSRLRDLRKPRYGAWTIEKRRIENSGAYEYRLKR